MEEAKAAYLKATKISGVSRESHMFKTRIGARSRAHLDKVFIEGAEQATATTGTNTLTDESAREQQ